MQLSAAEKLRQLLDRPGLLAMPGCHDAISAKLYEQAGFETAFRRTKISPVATSVLGAILNTGF